MRSPPLEPWQVCGFLTQAEPEAKRYFQDILQAIEYMHREGVCHRDLKPQNIILDKGCMRVKVTDFNVSKRFVTEEGGVRSRVTMATHTGTMAYMAPEALANEGYTYWQTPSAIGRAWTCGALERSCTRCSLATRPLTQTSSFRPYS